LLHTESWRLRVSDIVTALVGLAILAAIILLLVLRRYGKRKVNQFSTRLAAERKTDRTTDWLTQSLLLRTDPVTAKALIDKRAESDLHGVDHDGYSLRHPLDGEQVRARLTAAEGSVVLSPVWALDVNGVPEGNVWKDFRDRVAKAAAKAGIEIENRQTAGFVRLADAHGQPYWGPAAS
jgi:hypothetical protein